MLQLESDFMMKCLGKDFFVFVSFDLIQASGCVAEVWSVGSSILLAALVGVGPSVLRTCFCSCPNFCPGTSAVLGEEKQGHGRIN